MAETEATIEILESYHQNGGTYIIPNEVIIDVEGMLEDKDKEIERLNNIINELAKYIHNELILDFYDEDMPCELIINKMENMIKKLKGEDK